MSDKSLHQRLLKQNKAGCHRIGGKLLLGAGRELKNRRQRVELRDCFSGWKNEPWEVMQGPALFSAFTRDLEGVMNSEASSFVGGISSFK